MTDTAKSRDDSGTDKGLKDLLRDQQERQTRLRHVQEFISTPAFLDLSELAIEVSDDAEALDGRRRDLDYRIEVLRSVLALLEEERALMDRVESASGAEAEGADTPGAPDLTGTRGRP
ncbi:hypothetical protein LR948_10635 [Roseivivax sp. GX 12232]|uniref:hypothetical protein n=1 Tax=Roseivivax sp. GX 12232 TaxID=2900547 RepID=UPI001E451569|nr:hypothetical protein [Roseivivax sp. GX 12232]MCE0505814.1 hypothetical protein [Roseivivax sp. GX 12232]